MFIFIVFLFVIISDAIASSASESDTSAVTTNSSESNVGTNRKDLRTKQYGLRHDSFNSNADETRTTQDAELDNEDERGYLITRANLLRHEMESSSDLKGYVIRPKEILGSVSDVTTDFDDCEGSNSVRSGNPVKTNADAKNEHMFKEDFLQSYLDVILSKHDVIINEMKSKGKIREAQALEKKWEWLRKNKNLFVRMNEDLGNITRELVKMSLLGNGVLTSQVFRMIPDVENKESGYENEIIKYVDFLDDTYVSIVDENLLIQEMRNLIAILQGYVEVLIKFINEDTKIARRSAEREKHKAEKRVDSLRQELRRKKTELSNVFIPPFKREVGPDFREKKKKDLILPRLIEKFE